MLILLKNDVPITNVNREMKDKCVYVTNRDDNTTSE